MGYKKRKDDMKQTNTGSEAKPFSIGEKVDFDTFIENTVETKYGLATVVKFIKNRKVVRTTFAGSSLKNFLTQNKQAKSITLVDKIEDGDKTINLFA